LFDIFWTESAQIEFKRLKSDRSLEKQYKAVKKTLLLLAANPRHPGLKTHEYSSLKGPAKEKVFEAYAEQNTPAAYRVFWYYGPGKGEITVIAIVQHP